MLPCVGIHTSRKAFNQDDWYEDSKRVEIKRFWVLTIYMEKKQKFWLENQSGFPCGKLQKVWDVI